MQQIEITTTGDALRKRAKKAMRTPDAQRTPHQLAVIAKYEMEAKADPSGKRAKKAQPKVKTMPPAAKKVTSNKKATPTQTETAAKAPSRTELKDLRARARHLMQCRKEGTKLNASDREVIASYKALKLQGLYEGIIKKKVTVEAETETVAPKVATKKAKVVKAKIEAAVEAAVEATVEPKKAKSQPAKEEPQTKSVAPKATVAKSKAVRSADLSAYDYCIEKETAKCKGSRYEHFLGLGRKAAITEIVSKWAVSYDTAVKIYEEVKTTSDLQDQFKIIGERADSIMVTIRKAREEDVRRKSCSAKFTGKIPDTLKGYVMVDDMEATTKRLLLKDGTTITHIGQVTGDLITFVTNNSCDLVRNGKIAQVQKAFLKSTATEAVA